MPKWTHETLKAWKPPTPERQQQILASARARGLIQGSENPTFLIDDVIELFGPPERGLPIHRDDLVRYLERAQKLLDENPPCKAN